MGLNYLLRNSRKETNFEYCLRNSLIREVSLCKMILHLWRISSVEKNDINILSRENNIVTMHNRPSKYLLYLFWSGFLQFVFNPTAFFLFLCIKLLTQNYCSKGNVSSLSGTVLVTYAWEHRFRLPWITWYAVKWLTQTHTVTNKRKPLISAYAKLIGGGGMRSEPRRKILSKYFKSCLMKFLALVLFAPNGLLS